MPVWNEEGKTLEKELTSIWGAAFRDKGVRDWMSVVWEKWVVDNKFCRHWRKKKNKGSTGMNGGEEDTLEEQNDLGIELILEGDDEFENCRAGVWKEVDEQHDTESVMYGSSLLESFRSQETRDVGSDEVDETLEVNDEVEGEDDEDDDNEDEELEEAQQACTLKTRKKKVSGVSVQRKSTRVVKPVGV